MIYELINVLLLLCRLRVIQKSSLLVKVKRASKANDNDNSRLTNDVMIRIFFNLTSVRVRLS